MANNEESDSLELAISKATQKLEGYREGDMLVDWVVIAYVTNPENVEERDAYPMLFSNGNIATYKARGLLVTALDSLKND